MLPYYVYAFSAAKLSGHILKKKRNKNRTLDYYQRDRWEEVYII